MLIPDIPLPRDNDTPNLYTMNVFENGGMVTETACMAPDVRGSNRALRIPDVKSTLLMKELKFVIGPTVASGDLVLEFAYDHHQPGEDEFETDIG